MKSLTQSLSAMCLIALALAAGACSSGREVLEKDLAEMKSNLTKLRATSLALQDRLDALEAQKSEAVDLDDMAEQRDGSHGDRPALEVVHLVPEEVGASEEPEATGPAPNEEEPMVIRNNARGVPEIQKPKAPPKWRR